MKNKFKRAVLMTVAILVVACSNENLLRQDEDENVKSREELIASNIGANEVVVRDYQRNYNGNDLLNKMLYKSRGEDTTSDDFLMEEAQKYLEEFFGDMPDEAKAEFEKACINGDVKIDFDFVSTLALENTAELTSDYVMAKVAEGEMIKEIDSALNDCELVVENLENLQELANYENLYNNEYISRGNNRKLFSYRKYGCSRGDLNENETVVSAEKFTIFLAKFNYKEDIENICKLFKKKIDFKKIENYHNIIQKQENISRSASSGAGFYNKTLITNDEIQKEVSQSILKTGQIICRRGKLVNDFCIYGEYDHAGIIDLRDYINDRKVTADIWSHTVFSAYPYFLKDSMQGKRAPERVGYASFEPVANFAQGKKIAIMEPLNRNKMESATKYVVSRKNNTNHVYDLIDNYCSYMPYYGYKGVGIDLNSDPQNHTCFFVITPDDIYGSQYDKYGYSWIKVWIPTYALRWIRTGAWWQGKWEWYNNGGYYAWRYGYNKIYSKATNRVLYREQ